MRSRRIRALVLCATLVGGAAASLVAAPPASAVPGNNNFANATTLLSTGTLTQSTVGATFEASEPSPVTGSAIASVWFKWTAPTTRTVIFDTIKTQMDSVMSVYTGTAIDSLTEVVSDDDGSGCDTTSHVQFDAVQGTQYYIQVGGLLDTDVTSSLRLTWNGGWNNYPLNDNIANATVLSGASNATKTGSTIDATAEAAFDSSIESTDQPAVWFKLVASFDMDLEVDVRDGINNNAYGDSPIHEADVYTGTPPALDFQDFATDGASATVTVAQGATVYIAIRPDLICNEGNYTLLTTITNVSTPSAPTNLNAIAGDGSAVVSFTPSASAGGAPIEYYTLSTEDGLIQEDGVKSPITLAGLTNGVSYRFYLVATNAYGDSVHSSFSNTVTPSTAAGAAFTSGPRPTLNGTYIPIAGDFDGSGATDILWYRPGTSTDLLRRGYPDGKFVDGPAVNINGTYKPLSGDFTCDGLDDIFWYAPGTGSEAFWQGQNSSKPFKSRTVGQVGGVYSAFVGDFNGDGCDDVFWYAPGTAKDAMWLGSNSLTSPFKAGPAVSVSGTYKPISGDFNGDGADDVLWYAPGTAADYLKIGSIFGLLPGPSVTINGTYVGSAGDYNGDNEDDIVWYSSSGNDALSRGTPSGFVPGPKVSFGSSLILIPGDFNADGNDDILAFSRTAADALWLGA